MAAPKYLRVRNWDQYQHYQSGKQAKPPLTWVKLYTSMLLDYELTGLTTEAQLLADRLLLVAGMTGNSIMNDPKWIASAAKVNPKWTKSALDELRAIGFIEPVSSRELSRRKLDQKRVEEKREETPLEPPFEGNAVENLARLKLLTNGLLREVA